MAHYLVKAKPRKDRLQELKQIEHLPRLWERKGG